MNSSDFIAFLKKHCDEQLSKITETKGVWSHEKGLQEAYQDIKGFINCFNNEHVNG